MAVKQLLLLVTLMAVGLPWTIINPFVGVVLFYALDLIHPETLWWYAAGAFAEVRWSFYVAAITVLSFLLHLPVANKKNRRWPIEKKMMLLFAVCVGFSTLMAERTATVMTIAEAYGKIFLMYFVATSLIDRESRLKVMFWTTAFCLWYVAQDFNQLYVLHNHWEIGYKGFGGLDNNGLALFMVMAIPFAYWGCTQAKRLYVRVGALAGILMMMHVVLFTYSRGGMLAMMATGLFLLWRMPKTAWKPIILIALVAVTLTLSGPRVRKRFFSIEQHEIDESALARKMNWKAAIRIMQDNRYMLHGVGPRGFAKVNLEFGGTGRGRAVHNQFLQIGADLGAPAMVLFIGILASTFLSAGRIRRRYRDVPSLAGYALAIQASLVGYSVAAIFLSLDRFEFIYLVLALGVSLKGIAAREAKTAHHAKTEKDSVHVKIPAKALGGLETS